MLSIFGFERIFHVVCQPFAFGFLIGMIEKDICLLFFAATVYMDEDSATVSIVLTVFPIKSIDFVATLLKTLHLIQWNRVAHTSLTFTVGEVSIITDTIFGILNNDMHFRPFLHQIPGETKCNVIGIFVFVKFVLPYPSDGSRIRTAMPADYIEAGTCQSVGSDLYIRQLLTEKRFMKSGSYFRSL